MADNGSNINIEDVFVSLRRAWHPPSAAVETSFTRLTQNLGGIFSALLSDPDLAGLHAEIYRDFPGLSAATRRAAERSLASAQAGDPADKAEAENEAVRRRKGFYLCYSLIQLMEDVYLDLRLEEDYRHPDNRGWMNLFRHWSHSNIFRETWAVAASTFGLRFQNFCNRRLSLSLGATDLVSVWDKTYSPMKNPPELGPLDAPEAKRFEDVETRLIDMLMSKTVRGVENPIADRIQQILVARLLVPSNETAERQTIGKRPLTPEEREDLLEVNFGIVAITTGKDGKKPGALLTLAIRRQLREQGLGRRLMRDLVCRLGVNEIRMPENKELSVIGLPTGSRERLKNLFESVLNEVKLSEMREQAKPPEPNTSASAIFGDMPRLPYSGVVRPPCVTWAHAVGFCFWVLAGADRMEEESEDAATRALRDADAAARVSKDEENMVRQALSNWAGDSVDRKETDSIAVESRSWYLSAKRPVEALRPEVETIVDQLHGQAWFGEQHRRSLVAGLDEIASADKEVSPEEIALVELIKVRLPYKPPHA